MVYGARYGRQPISEMLALSVGDFDAFLHALSDLVSSENGK